MSLLETKQEREVGGNLVEHASALGINDRSQTVLEPELSTALTNEIDHREVTLARSPTEAAPELLDKDGRRRC